MKFYDDKSKKEFNEWKKKNSYLTSSSEIVKLTVRWAKMMEAHIDNLPNSWKNDLDIADCNHKDDFQRGAAAAALMRWWKYGYVLYQLDPELFGDGWRSYFQQRCETGLNKNKDK